MESKYLTNKVFTDIVNGYSVINISNETVYIKHFNVIDDTEIEFYKDAKYTEALNKGLKKESDQLKFLTDKNLWTEDDETQLIGLKYYLERLKDDVKIAWLPSQIKSKKDDITKAEIEYYSKLEIKDSLIGLSAEKYAQKQSNSFYIYCSLYKDLTLKEKLYNKDKFEDLETEEINLLTYKFNEAIDCLNEDNIKKTACSNLFQNIYNLSDSNKNFLGKPICYFTYYQVSLLSYGNYYKHILGDLGDIPDEIRNNPSKLEEHYTTSKNIQKIVDKKQKDNSTVGIMGATKEDIEALGLNSQKSVNETKIEKALSEQGEISMMDAIRMGM
jgi:hypothetical protein